MNKIANPVKLPVTPHGILGNVTLSRSEKVRLLKEWEYDLRLEMTSTEENMTRSKNPISSGELLRQVHLCLAELGEKSSAGEASGKV